MIYKLRVEPVELKILRSLNSRMDLSERDKQNYYYLKKGYEGEVMFDSLTEKLQCECYILNDLLLEVNSTMFQIDTLIISQNTIYLFEVKNYEGDFLYDSERLCTKAKSEIKNPVHQLKRSESLLRQLLQNLKFHFTLEAWVVFINPEFTLYQAPLNEPIILPTQVHRYFKKLNTIPSNLNGKHKKLAEQLVSLHMKESPYTKLPAYEYHQPQKGITCAVCHSLLILVDGNKCVCEHCGHEEKLESAVLRNVEEIQLLFPERRITTNEVYEWCKVVGSKKRISRVLGKHYKRIGVHQWTYYE